MRRGNKSTRNEQKFKVLQNVIFLLKRIIVKLMRSILHEMKSLKDYFIPSEGATETFRYPG